MFIRLSTAILMSFTVNAAAETLVTDNFTIEIRNNCAEGDVVCDDISYHAKSHKSGNQLRLKGKTLSRMCADGVTPCQFLGYQFKNGNTTYTVWDDVDSGRLEVQQAGKTLVNETGHWLHR